MQRTVITVLLFALTILTPFSIPAQQPTPQPQGEEKIVSGTTEVLLDAVVKDKKGRAVKDLNASDFQIVEDGMVQEVKSFHLVAGDAGGNDPAAKATPLKPADAVRRVREDFNSGRIGAVALVFDRLSLDSRRRAHDAALSYIDSGLGPNDFIGVFGIDQTLSVLQTFTNNQQLVKDALDRAGAGNSTTASTTTNQVNNLAQRNLEIAHQLGLAEGAAGQATAATAADTIGGLATQLVLNRVALDTAQGFERLEQTQQGLATTAGLLSLISAMGQLPGRKAVIFFSEGVTVPTAVAQDFKTVIGNANRANVSIYTVDAVGLRVKSAQSDAAQALTTLGQQRAAQAAGSNDNFGSMMRDSERGEELVRHTPESSLAQLADQTGGMLVSGTNNPAARLRQVNEDLHTYYVLTYSPKNQNFDGKFRQISIKVNRGGTEVQTRKGYYGLPTTYGSAVMAFEASPLALLGGKSQPNAFPTKAAAFSFPEANRTGLVPVIVEVPAGSVNFVSDPAKKTYRTDFTILVLIKDELQHVVRKLSYQYLLGGALDQLDNAKRSPTLFYRETDLEPGRYSVDAIVYDATNGQFSINHGSLLVPDSDQTKLRVSNLIVISKAKKATPGDPQDNPFKVGDLFLFPNLGEAVHKAGSKGLSMFVTIYQAKGASAAPKMTIELDQNGQPLGQLPVELPAPDNNGRIQYTATLPLDAFPPGDYELKAMVTDGATKALRSERFTVQP